MSCSFELSFASPASVEQIHAAFRDRDYWLARLASLDGGIRTLDSLDVDSDGTVHVVNVENLRHGGMPRILAAVYRGDLNIVTTETWTPTGDGRVDGAVNVDVIGAPGCGHGSGVLAPANRGSQLSLSATVEFKVPLVGGKIENYLAGVFSDGLYRIQQFTTDWIGEHA